MDTIVEFYEKLKNLKSYGSKNISKTAFQVFSFIELFRMSIGIDSITMVYKFILYF